jgi:hypothetical protein
MMAFLLEGTFAIGSGGTPSVSLNLIAGHQVRVAVMAIRP